MTEDGETPDGSDSDAERRASSNADEERSSSDGSELDPGEPSSPGESERDGGASSRDAETDRATDGVPDPVEPASTAATADAPDGSERSPEGGPRAAGGQRDGNSAAADDGDGPQADSRGAAGWADGREGDSGADEGRDVDAAPAGAEVAAGIETVVDERDGGNDEPGAGVSAGQRPSAAAAPADEPHDDVPADVRSYDRFQKIDRASYDRVNEFLRDRTYITAREWAIARLCADFRTATGVEMTKIGENLPHLVPFMTDTYSPQAVNQARSAFEEKVRMSGATFLYGAMSGFFTADELDEIMYEVTEVAKFLLEVEGVELAVDEELAAEDRISAVMREVQRASEELRHEGVECPECGHRLRESGAGTEIE